MKNLVRVIRWIGELLVILTAIIAIAWAFGAVWFDAPFGNANKFVAGLLAVASVAALVFVRPFWRKIGAVALLFAGVLTWWLTLSPTNDSDWQPDVAQKAWADIQGDEVTLHNVRNCDYRTETDYTPHWETRTVHISQITGIDLAIDYWGSPWIAHPIVSFQFADAPPLCFSIETRKKLGQTYSTIGGLYRQFELIYIVADERDVIRLRTNYRKRTRVNVYLNTSIRSTLCGTNRAGIMPSPPTALRASARSIHPTSACHGIGASCLTAKATNCCMNATSSSPAGFPLPS